MKASIDIGSNSCLFLAGTFEGRNFRESSNLSEITGLGRDLDKNKKFIPEAIEDTYQALSKYKQECVRLGINPSDVLVTATEASRVAENAAELYDRVESDLGFQTQIINGEGEAYYTSLGASLGYQGNDSELTLMDIGGASTEVIKIQLNPFKVVSSISLPVGVVRLTEYKQASREEEAWQKALGNFKDKDYQAAKLIGIAGTVTAQMAMILDLKSYDDQKVHGQSLSREDYVDFSNKLYALPVDQIKINFEYLTKRAPYLHAGADIILRFTELLNTQTLVVSTYGVRHGTLFSGAIDSRFVSK